MNAKARPALVFVLAATLALAFGASIPQTATSGEFDGPVIPQQILLESGVSPLGEVRPGVDGSAAEAARANLSALETYSGVLGAAGNWVPQAPLLGLTGDNKRPDGFYQPLPGFPSGDGAFVNAVLSTNGSANPADHRLYLIGILPPGFMWNPPWFQPDDFEFTVGGQDTVVGGLTFAIHPLNAKAGGESGNYFNVLEVSGLENLPAALTTSDFVRWRNPLRGGFPPRNGSRLPITRGPAISRAEVFVGFGDVSIVSDKAIRVWFTHEITAGTTNGGPAEGDFTFPELGTNGTLAWASGNAFIDIFFNDNDTQGAPREGITAIRMLTNALTGRRFGGVATENGPGSPRWHCTVNEGPYIVRASLTDSDTITLALSDDINMATVQTGNTSAFSLSSGSYTFIDSNDGDNVLMLRGLSGVSVGDTVDISNGFEIADYQFNAGRAFLGTEIVAPPIITLAKHDDNGTDQLSDDRITLFMDQSFDNPPALGNFGFRGFLAAGATVALPAPGTNQIDIIDLTDTWTQGDRVYLSDTLSITYSTGSNPSPDTTHAWIRDGSAPRHVGFAPSPGFTEDIDDSAFVGGDEFGPFDDSAYYLVWLRRQVDAEPDFDFKTDNITNAVLVYDPSPSVSLTNSDLNSAIIFACLIDTMSTDSAGDTLRAGDDVFFWANPVDKEGNWEPGDSFLLGSLVAGPLACPRDTLLGDNDAIHVFGVDPSSDGPYLTDTHYVCGDPGSAPPDADSVYVFADSASTILLGVGAVNKSPGLEGSFGPIELVDPPGFPGISTTVPLIWLRSGQNAGATVLLSADACPYINDNEFPTLESAEDPVNGLKCYSPGDTVHLLVQAFDPADLGDGGFFPNARNALLHLWADLSEYVTTPGADSVVLISLGANREDDDNDWIDVSPQAAFTGNGVRDFPEPYVDENGDGSYTPGETFIDIQGAGYTDGVYDYGDANLDSNDPDEMGWFYLPGYWLNPADITADPNGAVNFAKLEDLPIPICIEDNAALSDNDDNLSNGGDFAAQMSAITGKSGWVDAFSAQCPSFSLEHKIVDESCLGTLDAQAPTVSEISFLEREAGLLLGGAHNPDDNIIFPGDHCYTIAAGEAGSYFNLADSVLSDDDVTLVALQINTGGGWEYLSFDPPGDANGDGAPGILDYDDDEDGLADFLDPEVEDAMQDSTADANGDNDGIYRTTDRVDNDGDAFFRYNPIYGTYLWFNIDENQTNNIDDNGNGQIDDAGEVETYVAANDDDEDGIEDATRANFSTSTSNFIQTATGPPGVVVLGLPCFEDPSQIAEYAGTPASSSPDYLEDSSLTASWPNAMVTAGTLLKTGLLDYYPNPYEILSGVMNGADDLSFFACAAPNVMSAAYTLGPVVIDPSFVLPAFDYRTVKGKNLNMRLIKENYGIVDGDEFHIRGVAFDQCFQGNPNWAVPLCLITDSGVADADIPADLFDMEPVCDVLLTDLTPATYTLEAEITGDITDIASVEFQRWDPATEMWVAVGTDASAPYTFDYTHPNSPLNNDPPDNRDTCYFRAIATDGFGNIEDDILCDSLYTEPGGDPCFELELIIIDCTPPMSCLCQVGYDYDLSDGAFVPSESAVDLSAWFTDGDGDSTTNDVIRVLFEYRPVGTQEWLMINSLTGVPAPGDSLVDVTGIKHVVIQTGPDTLKATVTWDTRDLEAGSYELRAVAQDIEGNHNATMACVFSVTVDDIGLRAYIQPCIPVDVNTDSLFANVYIHDVAVANVQFQYYEDTNGNGIDDDGNVWIPIDTVGVGGERKGDVILRAGTTPYNHVKDATYRTFAGTDYWFFDVDGDGYNPVDPVIESTDGFFDEGVDDVIIMTGFLVEDGAELSEFAPQEYFADQDGDGELELTDWILLNNVANPNPDTQLDLWCTVWEVTGLSGCYLTRAVATDVLGNTDDDEDGDGVPDSSPTEIWTEECCIDTDIPIFCITHYVTAAGDTVELPDDLTCPWVPAQEELIFIATLVDGDPAGVDSVRFQYSNDGGFTWHWFATDFFGPDWSGVFPYADFDLITDTQFNFRSRAYKNGMTGLDPDACKACLVLGENRGPETDIVMAITAEDDTLDTNTVLRGNISPLCLDPTTLYMLVTAEDNAAIDSVWFMYRKVAGTDPFDVFDWTKLTEGITPVADSTYPYEFTWDLTTLTDGVYEFFPRAVDSNGNVTPTFGNPFVISFSSRTAMITAVEQLGLSIDELIPGEEAVVFAELDDPTDNLGVGVNFWYAERIEGEVLDVLPVQPHTADTDHTIYSNSMAGEHGSETVYVGGAPATYHTVAEFNTLVAPTALDYTILDPNTLRFGLAPTEEVTIDYNVTECRAINEGDNETPYTVAWDADSPDGLIPSPTNDWTTHYDIIATAYRVYRDEDGEIIGTCEEDCHSDDFALPIADTEAPDFTIHGLLCEFGDNEPRILQGAGGVLETAGANPVFFNATGNPLCSSCGGDDRVGTLGDCKCKLSGIEHQIFVTGDNDTATADIDSVWMSVGGDPPVAFDKYTANDDTVITIPLSFNIDDLADVTANGWSTKAVNPDSVENVTITIAGIGVFNAEMNDLGNGWYQYQAILPIPDTGTTSYSYSFSVDLVGDDQVEDISDPRWFYSTILVPAEFWCYSILDPAAFWGENEVDQIHFTVVDSAGNSSNELISGAGDEGAAGQVWVTYDNKPQEVRSIFLTESPFFGEPALPEDDPDHVTVAVGAWIQADVEIGDVVPPTADIITVEGVILQVSVDDTNARWRTIHTDFVNNDDPGPFLVDGGWGGTFQLPGWMNPYTDGIDNDRDGSTDEEDEKIYTYGFRVVTVDDCFNYGYSCGHPRAQDPEVCGTITIDADIPQACITSPTDGQIISMGDVIDITAETEDDDVWFVRFEYMDPNDPGDWDPIDPTPLNDDDDDGKTAYAVFDEDGDGVFEVSWDTDFFNGFAGADFYLRIRAVAVDYVCNEQDSDPELDCDVNIILNDTTGPMAAITAFAADCFPEDPELELNIKRPFDPTLALSGEVFVVGRAWGWNQYDVATVVLQLSEDGETGWTTIAVQQDFLVATFFSTQGALWLMPWNTDLYEEGTYYLRVYATDTDGNVTNDEDGDGEPDDLIVVSVTVDHTPPDAELVRVGPDGYGGEPFEEGDIIRADLWHEELGICFEHSEEITFQGESVDVDGDVEFINSMTLQWLDDVTDVENPVWRSLRDFEYRDFPGDGLNPDGKWVLTYDEIDDLADDMADGAGLFSRGILPAKEYWFRMRGEDYACNANEDNTGVLLRLDHINPDITHIYAGDVTFEAGSGAEGNTVHVAGGDIVPLAAHVEDVLRIVAPDGLDNGGGKIWEHETSGMFAVQFNYVDGNDNEVVIGLGEYDDGGTPGTDSKATFDDLWKIDWETPMNMPGTTDTLYTIVVYARDNANDCEDEDAEDLVAVQDVTPPEDTKLWAVEGIECIDGHGNTYPWTDLTEALLFDATSGVLDLSGDGGDEMGIDNTVLSQDLTGTDPVGTVARGVWLWASTPNGDASMLGGLSPSPAGVLPGAQLYDPVVYFEGRRLVNGVPGPWMLIGEGECYNCGLLDLQDASVEGVQDAAISPQGPLWVTWWDTKSVDAGGDFLWFDPEMDGSSVQVRAWARDAWGNEEVMREDAMYHLVVDNTSPVLEITVHQPPTMVEITEIERNNPEGIIIQASGGDPSVFVNDDLVVEFYYKLSSDLDVGSSWIFIDEDFGIAPNDDNGDETRPYSFHWDTNKHRDPDGDPLVVNEDYDLGVTAYDLVCNVTEVEGATKRDEHTTIKFVDTIPPQATITDLIRNYDETFDEICEEQVASDHRVVENPENERVNGIDELWARILDGASDTQDVKFYYRAAGTTAWTLADGDVFLKNLGNGDGELPTQVWTLENWDASVLAEGAWEFAAVATDDAGNTDQDPPILTLILDRTGPVFAGANPVDDQIIVPENIVNGIPFPRGIEECFPNRRVADIVASSDDTDVLYENAWDNCVTFEWKRSALEDVDENWNSFGMTLYDGFTDRYSTTIDLLADHGGGGPDGRIADGLIDWRVVASDVAGNGSKTVIAERTVVDNTDPDLEITHFHILGHNDDGHETTIDPIDNGQITDVSHGDEIQIWATVDDDEVDIPASHETDVVEVQFFVRPQFSSEWNLIGTAGYDEALGLWGVKWNTTGLTSTGNDVDVFEIIAYATDEAANCGPAHESVQVHVTNKAVPLAQVAGFNPDLLSVITKGTNDYVYGLTFGEKEADKVFFQYRPVGTSDWVTIGVGESTGEFLTTRQTSLIDQELWMSVVRTSNWDDNSTIEIRAVGVNQVNEDFDEPIVASGAEPGIAPTGVSMKRDIQGQGGVELMDGDPDIFSGLYDLENTPVLVVNVDKAPDGSTVLTPADDLGYFADEAIQVYLTDSIRDGRIEIQTTSPVIAPFVVVVAEDGAGAIDEYIPELNKKADDNTAWAGQLFNNSSNFSGVDPTEGALMTVYASAHLKRTSSEDPPGPRIEMVSKPMIIHQVTQNLGSNGVAGIYGNGAAASDGYPADEFAMRIPAGAVSSDYGLLMKKTDMPLTPEWQDRYIETVGTAYRTTMLSNIWSTQTVTASSGYSAEIWIRYDEADLPEGTDEATLQPQMWTGSSWTRSGITHVQVDTENNVIRFRTRDLSTEIFAIVATDEAAPLEISFAPYWNGWTDQDPIIRGLIRSTGSGINVDSIELYIDGMLVFNAYDYYFKYSGSQFDWWYADEDATTLAFEYDHTCVNADALTNGTHTVQVLWRDYDGDAYFGSEIEFEFLVDRNAPFITLHGGFLGNPVTEFDSPYVNLEDGLLTLELYDGESGIMFREDRVRDFSTNDGNDDCEEFRLQDSFCELEWVYCGDDRQTDGGLKFDVWVIRDQEDQGVPDEIEDRTLIFTGTADMLAPYTDPPLNEYTPGDTIRVPLAVILGGELIEDESVIEITVYSERLLFGGPLEFDEYLDDIEALILLLEGLGIEIHLNDETGLYVAYLNGVMDCVYNSGSRYVEQRYIVDETGPEVVPTSPGVACGGATPEGAVDAAPCYTFSAAFVDGGVGVDPGSVSIQVAGPGTFEVGDPVVTPNGVSVEICSGSEARLAHGTYTVSISGEDKVGNEFHSTCKFTIGSSVVQVGAPMVIPNPFNPGVGDAIITFDLPKAAEVTIRAYDWSGDFVAQIFKGQLPVGQANIPWGGQAEDGTALANGVYLVRIVADDGSRQEPKIIKLALWNER